MHIRRLLAAQSCLFVFQRNVHMMLHNGNVALVVIVSVRLATDMLALLLRFVEVELLTS